ncbi:MAG: S-methyl-5-thioribose-1-phosphate isomerase [Gammaproteobacteria bacterium]|nr:S-methyl-5-thioribose-1-phosphate isomerase [Gammaproteobacteria bacterium]
MPPSAVEWHNDRLRLLDQRQLPHTISYLEITNIDEAWEAIHTLTVRGAPAIGIAAAYALVVAATSQPQADPHALVASLTTNAEHLCSARPTAVNLRWATSRICQAAERSPSLNSIRAEAEAIHAEDRAICQAIGAHGKHLIKAGAGVLTHCNAGALAVSELGTATAPMYLSHAEGKPFRVFVDETRPLLQGARLTAWELSAAGIDVRLICDNMAASIMAAGDIDLVLVGTDRVTANGDVVNKIGTLNLAVLCTHFDVPFYVALPSSTYDPHTGTGAEVTIEQRAPEEVLENRAAKVKVRNPAFDVTPAELVTAFVTERGIIRPPFAESLTKLLSVSD